MGLAPHCQGCWILSKSAPFEHTTFPQTHLSARKLSGAHRKAAFQVGETEAFGPQGRWSILLRRREILLEEIEHVLERLAQIRRDLPLYRGATQFPAKHHQRLQPRLLQTGATAAPSCDSLDRLFCAWLVRLESELDSVTRRLQGLARHNEAVVDETEQSMFALLRAAG